MAAAATATSPRPASHRLPGSGTLLVVGTEAAGVGNGGVADAGCGAVASRVTASAASVVSLEYVDMVRYAFSGGG